MTDELHLPRYVDHHCPWCHVDFENPAACYEHASVVHFGNDPEDWSMLGGIVGHSRQLSADGVTDVVGLIFLARYNAADADDGQPGAINVAIWMTPDAARQLGSHLIEQTEPERLAEVARLALEGEDDAPEDR
jgi:hypothetical protein